MTRKINWGIIGLGKIARSFAHDLKLHKDASLHGVAARNPERAKMFSEEFGASTWYHSYDELVQDPSIDIVYIATTHNFHFEHTMMCLRAGKSVLCEKPIGMNYREVKTMTKEARSRNLFLMEAIWTRFIPSFEKALELLQSNTIGKVYFIRADFGFRGDQNPERRIYNKNLGGGSLLDVGIYPIFLSLLTLGIPSEIKATARMSGSQVDSYCAMLFDYEEGQKAILESTIETQTPTEAYIFGESGSLKLHRSFHHARKLSLSKLGREKMVLDIDYTGNGYYHEIEEVSQCLINGNIESKKLPHSLSLDLITLLDRVREKIGLRYGEELMKH